MLTSVSWLRKCLSDFFIVKFLYFYPLSILPSLERSNYAQIIPKKQGVELYLLEGRVFTYIILNYSARGICVFSLLIYLYQYRLMDIYCILCVIILQHIILLLKIFPALAMGALSVDSYVSQTYPHHLSFVLLWLLSTFLLSGIRRCSRLICYISYLSPDLAIFPRNPGSSEKYWKPRFGCQVCLLLPGNC